MKENVNCASFERPLTGELLTAMYRDTFLMDLSNENTLYILQIK